MRQNKWFPIHFAARIGSLDICKLLIDDGSDINIKNNLICIPLLNLLVILFTKRQKYLTFNVILMQSANTPLH